MSLILEALRKSEAERRRGQVPDLHAELPPIAQPARDRPPAWLWLALVLGFVAVIATTWLARDLWWPARTIEPMPEFADPAAAVDAAGVGSIVTSTPSVDGSVAVAAASSAVTAEPVEPPRIAATIPGSRPPATPTASKAAPAEPMAAPLRLAEPAAATSARDARSAVVNPPPAVARTPASAKPQARAIAPAPAAPVAAAPVATPVATTPASVAVTPAVGSVTPARLADLAASDRRELPPLKISMHMWNPAPAQRFAIIDGNRVTEGSRVGDAVIDEITSNGVVLAWQGRRLLLPIR